MKEVVDVKVNKELKEACDDLFNALGLDTETAINIFLAASLRDMGIPFHIGFKEDDCDCDCDCHCKDCDCEECDCGDCDCEDCD